MPVKPGARPENVTPAGSVPTSNSGSFRVRINLVHSAGIPLSTGQSTAPKPVAYTTRASPGRAGRSKLTGALSECTRAKISGDAATTGASTALLIPPSASTVIDTAPSGTSHGIWTTASDAEIENSGALTPSTATKLRAA